MSIGLLSLWINRVAGTRTLSVKGSCTSKAFQGLILPGLVWRVSPFVPRKVGTWLTLPVPSRPQPLGLPPALPSCPRATSLAVGFTYFEALSKQGFGSLYKKGSLHDVFTHLYPGLPTSTFFSAVSTFPSSYRPDFHIPILSHFKKLTEGLNLVKG